MHFKTIFNRVTNFKPFVVEHTELVEKELGMILEVTMRARENGQPTCSGCGQRGSQYDTQPTPRRFEFIPLWMIPVVLIYTMRRVNCQRCGVRVESVPWSDGTRKSYGFRTQEAYETALYHNLGNLPEPEFTHRFF